MEADTTPTPWSKICVSHADCILLVGAADAQPEVMLCVCCAKSAASISVVSLQRCGCVVQAAVGFLLLTVGPKPQSGSCCRR